MADHISCVSYVFHHHPVALDVSIQQMIQMMYLADWKSSLEYRRQITPLQWCLFRSHPYSVTLSEDIRYSGIFELSGLCSDCRNDEISITGINPRFRPTKIPRHSEEVLDFVIATTESHTPMELTRLVCSTFPVLTQPEDAILDLPFLAESYMNSRQC